MTAQKTTKVAPLKPQSLAEVLVDLTRLRDKLHALSDHADRLAWATNDLAIQVADHADKEVTK